ncbi:MAG: glycosyltransferase [Thermoanaerobaculales bacterium]|nr:glycosyltransferase [Thermoanaerobaculales bacterium]
MAAQPLRHRLQGWLWEASPPLRGWLRRLRTSVSLARHRALGRLGRGVGPRIALSAAATPRPAIPHPAIEVVGAIPRDQTESSLVATGGAGGTAPYLANGDGLERLPAAHLEALLLAAAAEDLEWLAAGWAAPAPGAHGPSGLAGREESVAPAAHLLLRRPAAARPQRPAVVGRVLPHLTAAERCPGLVPVDDHDAAGPYRLRPETARAAVVRRPWSAVDEVLAALPPVEGPPTALFLLPFLAVGGAERLLFDLLAGLAGRCRSLIVTTDAHLASLGQTVDRARELTPHVYTLGDWLPRPAITSAVRHLIRRWRVGTLVSWNPTGLFFDEAAALRRAFPGMRLLSQLFNHRGGWIEHLSPSFVRAVDAHIAVNTPIARALVGERGVPADRVVTIHHAVGAPGPRDEASRRRLRGELGVADDTVVIGSFIRMHPQKRPLDIVRLARRMAGDPVHFLLVGGGPLDAALDAEIASDPPPNLTRRPQLADATPLYAALDLCLTTSAFEGLPVFLLDGLARGIPCVATGVGDIPLALAEGGGRVVERPGDLEGLAAAVRALLDPETRRAEGERGRRAVIARFGLERFVAAYRSALFPDDSSARA